MKRIITLIVTVLAIIAAAAFTAACSKGGGVDGNAVPPPVTGGGDNMTVPEDTGVADTSNPVWLAMAGSKSVNGVDYGVMLTLNKNKTYAAVTSKVAANGAITYDNYGGAWRRRTVPNEDYIEFFMTEDGSQTEVEGTIDFMEVTERDVTRDQYYVLQIDIKAGGDTVPAMKLHVYFDPLNSRPDYADYKDKALAMEYVGYVEFLAGPGPLRWGYDLKLYADGTFYAYECLKSVRMSHSGTYVIDGGVIRLTTPANEAPNEEIDFSEGILHGHLRLNNGFLVSDGYHSTYPTGVTLVRVNAAE
ncbi:MAG: hypothetical protein LBP26_06570 [Clostridiales bacterium]|jgi:hypothetical protein|nr:hypothetical protein [Clostridiales bacterium]